MSTPSPMLPPTADGGAAPGRCWRLLLVGGCAAVAVGGLLTQALAPQCEPAWASALLAAAAAVLPLWLARQLQLHRRRLAALSARAQQQDTRLQQLARDEELLRRAEQVAQLGCFDWNPDTGALHWSAEHYRIWGHAPGAVRPDYAAFRARIHPDDLGPLEARLQHALHTGTGYVFNHRVLWPDGTVREVLARGDVTRDAGGRAVRMVGTVQDITRHRAAEQRLQLHEFVLNTITDPVSVVDERGMCLLVNQAWCRAAGRRAEDAVGRPDADLQRGSDPARSAALQRCIASGRPEVVLARHDLDRNGPRWWETTLFPFDDARGGGRRGAALIARDVSAREAAARALAASVEHLRLTLNTTGDAIFASDAPSPHAPLLFVNDRMLQMWDIPPAQADGLTPAGVLAAARRYFVDPARELARIDEVIASQTVQEDRLTLTDGRVLLRRHIPTTLDGRALRVWSFRDITVEARALAGLRAAESQQRALLAAFPGYIACISAEHRLTFANPRLAALLQTTPQALVGQSAGLLVDAENPQQLAHRIARVFDGEVVRFERSFSAGAGQPPVLVLTTLARSLDRHAGPMQCYAFGTDITPQKQTEATLPAATPVAAAGADVGGAPGTGPQPGLPTGAAPPALAPAGPAAAEDDAPAAAADRPPLQVLYIDDNPVNTLLMDAMFERLPGLALRCESDPLQGLALALADPPSLLLIDIQMPEMDGYELLQRLRAEPATRDVPAVAVSANAMPQDLARGQAAGFADYLTKPLEMHRLQATLQAVLPGWTPPP